MLASYQRYGEADQDFEKGEADEALDAMQILEHLVQTWAPQL